MTSVSVTVCIGVSDPFIERQEKEDERRGSANFGKKARMKRKLLGGDWFGSASSTHHDNPSPPSRSPFVLRYAEWLEEEEQEGGRAGGIGMQHNR